MQSLPIEIPPEFDPQLQRPAVGDVCYTIGGSATRWDEATQGPRPVSRLIELKGSWEHGVATVEWREPGRTWRDAGAPADTPGDPELRAQCFDSRYITSSFEVACASSMLLKRYGWNLR